MLKHRLAPLIFGVVVIGGLAAAMLLYRASPGDLSAPHAAVAGSSFIGDCRKCHASDGLAAGCRGCHEEIAAQVSAKAGFHGKTLQAKVVNCASCHSEHNGREFALVSKVSWGGGVPKTFDHAQADFKLAGRHAALACADCHRKKAPRFHLPRFAGTERAATFLGLSQACASCHNDPHAGGGAGDCARCHSQEKWKPASGFDHDKFYPLRDGHAALACSKCHAPGTASGAALFGKTRGRKCADCHATPHRTSWKLECAACHTERPVPWATGASRMTRVQHDATGFSAAKPHDKIACKACHDPAKPYAARYSQGRARAANACEVCHRDPHADQFLPKHPRCVDCHAAAGFKPALFTAKEHVAVYPLKDAHAKAACSDCHVREEALGAVRFAKTRADCAFCHKDPHAGQFRRDGRTNCESCHRGASSWKKLIFNHNDMSRFKLDSAHEKVACGECHPTARAQDGRRVILYKPLQSACGDCHDFKR